MVNLDLLFRSIICERFDIVFGSGALFAGDLLNKRGESLPEPLAVFQNLFIRFFYRGYAVIVHFRVSLDYHAVNK